MLKSLLTGAAALGAISAAAEDAPAAPPFAETLLAPLGSSFKEQYVSRILQPLRTRGRDGNYIDKALIAEFEADQIAQARRRIMSEELNRDLDANGVVTTQEVEAQVNKNSRPARPDVSPEIAKAQIDAEIAKQMTADDNKDGRITIEEMISYSKTRAQAQLSRGENELSRLLALDPNNDGKLTAAELNALALAAFEHFDLNRDDKIDVEESNAVREAMRALRTQENSAVAAPSLQCAPPAARDDDQIIVLGAYEGSGISTVAMAGQDIETSTGRLIIEPGDKPLYIYVTAYDASILRVEGAVERISKFVVAPQNVARPIGVTGVSASKISFEPPGACIKYFTDGESSAGRAAKAIISQALLRSDVKSIGAYTLGSWRIPSGAGSTATKALSGALVVQKGEDQYLLRDGNVSIVSRASELKNAARGKADPITLKNLKLYSPDGLVPIKLSDVVSQRPAEAYEVYPKEAGLIQLMEQDKIRRLSDGVYLIFAPIPRFPAGLGGAHGVKFMLGKGVPMPAGSPGHSCVISEETGKPVTPKNPTCR